MGKTQREFEQYSNDLQRQKLAILEAKKQLDTLLFRTDSHGNILYGKKGRPVIAWFRVIRNVGKIVALIEYLVKPLSNE